MAQRSRSGGESVAAAAAPTSLSASAGAENPQKKRAIVGPPLASRSHTMQIMIMLSLNSVLLLMCLYVLPAHLLWRKALKQANVLKYGVEQEDGPGNATLASSFALSAITSADADSRSATRNILTAFGLLFKIPLNDSMGAKWVKHAFRSALAALFLSQGWFVARLKGWWDEAEAMERGDREEVLSRRRVGISTQMENVTMSSFALPLPIAAWYLLIILCGGPATSNHIDTLFLSAYLSILIFLPAFALLGSDEAEWKKAFSFSQDVKSSSRFKLISIQAVCTVVGALLGSAGHLLDWERAWQIYPIPTILGACLGIVIGNGLGFISYYLALPSTISKVERSAPSSSSSNASKKKKKKQQ